MSPGLRPRVVIADDHRFFLETATTLLGSAFDVVAAVTRGEAAIAAAASLDPDLVVLDIAMPGLDGFQTASAILAHEPRRRIAFLSAHSEDDYVLEGLNRGASAFIPKTRMLRTSRSPRQACCRGGADRPGGITTCNCTRPADRRSTRSRISSAPRWKPVIQ